MYSVNKKFLILKILFLIKMINVYKMYFTEVSTCQVEKVIDLSFFSGNHTNEFYLPHISKTHLLNLTTSSSRYKSFRRTLYLRTISKNALTDKS